MFLSRKPPLGHIQRFLEESERLPLSYEPVGIARHAQPGFSIDEACAVLGSGHQTFAAAGAALQTWSHFDLGWVEIFPKRAPLAVGTTVVVLVRHLGFWSMNGCRIVYLMSGELPERSFGFAYGTLTNHAEQGEEIFAVSQRRDTGEVSYRIRAVSRPRAALARLGYPITRTLQASFRRDSVAAMRRAVVQGP